MKRTAVLVALLALTSCSQPANKENPKLRSDLEGLGRRVDAIEQSVSTMKSFDATPVAASDVHYTLIQTWINGTASPSSLQTDFASQAGCEKARQDLLAQRQAAMAKVQVEPASGAGHAQARPADALASALCVVR